VERLLEFSGEGGGSVSEVTTKIHSSSLVTARTLSGGV